MYVEVFQYKGCAVGSNYCIITRYERSNLESKDQINFKKRKKKTVTPI